MKKIFIILPFLTLIFILASCQRESYSVEKFLKETVSSTSITYNYIECNNIDDRIQDRNREIRNILLDGVEYKKTGKFKKTEKFFKWYKYLSHGKSKEKEATMYFYADGYVLINKKYNSGSNNVYYFKLKEKAFDIYSFVESKIEESLTIREEAFEIAELGPNNINDFLNVLETNIDACRYYYNDKHKLYLHSIPEEDIRDFSGKDELINLLLNGKYETEICCRKEYYYLIPPVCDVVIYADYNSSELSNPLWYMTVEGGGVIFLVLLFEDALGRECSITYQYYCSSVSTEITSLAK